MLLLITKNIIATAKECDVKGERWRDKNSEKERKRGDIRETKTG